MSDLTFGNMICLLRAQESEMDITSLPGNQIVAAISLGIHRV